MKKIIMLSAIGFMLSGCIWDLYPSYVVSDMGYFVDKNGNKAPIEDRHECSKGIGDLEFYAECLYTKGYRFRTESFAYCYRRPKSCEIYNKYR
ncbi:hypothetical protein EV697_10817 [Bisgaardia hudsonensis]|uniref:Lipoprotein n=1 Tax=Bisgaardia hudsonensis TaxID=109472 RepID=A0A4R2MRC6_9PAST|nr:hypothetical protein [Bisgaardia hudsonensis]QLB12880.1 hypothetical protein A6A11_04285 [Bisgaardia hudsonensis]TCP11294.1 hypothetical protein EV697_10817 [Bisgaardia hudsonensis]